MNSFLNIEVRVVGVQNVEARLAMIERALKRVRGTTGAVGNLAAQMFPGLDGALARLSNLGRSISTVGRHITSFITLPLMLAGIAAGKFAMENERAFTQLRKVYGSLDTPIAKVNSDLKLLRGIFESLSTIYGVQQSEVIRIGALWAAAGDQGVSLAKSVRLTLDTMVLGEMAYEDAAKALIVLRTQYGLTADELKSAMASLNVVENETAVSYTDLIQAIVRGGGAAVSAGVDIRHFIAMVAALVPTVGTAERAGNALKTMFSRLFDTPKKSREVLKEIGIDIDAVSWNALNGSQRLELMADKFQDLTSAEQAQAAAIIGTRYGFSALATLFRDMPNKMGNYQKALRKTADEQKNLAVYQKELRTVLESDPQAFQRAWVALQNAMARAIIPLLPAILGLIQGIGQLVDKFTELSPSTQKFILVSLAALAIFGPLAAALGSIIELVALLGKAFLVSAAHMIVWTKKMVGSIIAMFTVGGAEGQAASLGTRIMGALQAGMTAGMAFVRTVAVRFYVMWNAAMEAVAPAFAAAGARITALFTAGLNAGLTGGKMVLGRIAWLAQQIMLVAGPMFARAGAAAAALFQAGFNFLSGAVLRVMLAAQSAAAATGPAWVAMGAFFGALFSSGMAIVVPALGALGTMAAAAFGVGLTGGAAVAVGAAVILLTVAAVAALVIFRRQIASAFSGVWDWLSESTRVALQGIVDLFGALPRAIGNGLMAVYRTVVEIGKGIYEALRDFLNPWQRHSPSLVDLVLSGLDVISDKYKSLRDLGSAFRAAVSDIRAFKAAVQDAVEASRVQDRGQTLADLGKKNPGAIPDAIGIFGVQDRLYASLDRVTRAYGKQELVIQSWENRLKSSQRTLEAERRKLEELQRAATAINDKLTVAQAGLDKWSRTPIAGMKKMSDAIFDNEMRAKALELQIMRLEGAAGSIDKMRGDLELLTGERNRLRLLGAGSDVLGGLDTQIAQITGPNGVGGLLDQIAKLTAELEKVRRRGQELQLEQSLAFDPLTRQIDEVVNAMKEMPFSTIIAHIRSQKANVDHLTDAYVAANKKVKAQQAIVDSVERSHDRIDRTYQREKDKLDKLGDAYDTIKQMIDALDQALRSASGSAGGLSDSLLGAAGAGNFKDVKGSGFGLPTEGDLQKYFDQVAEDAKNAMGDFDIGEILFGPFKGFFTKLKTNFDIGAKYIIDFWGNFFGSVGATIKERLGNLFSGDNFAKTFDPRGKWGVVTWFNKGWDALTRWWDATGYPFIRDIPAMIIAAFMRLPALVRDALLAIGKIIIAPFVWAYDVLLGHSIIPDIVNGIVGWFASLPGRLVGAIGRAPAALINWGADLGRQILGSLAGVFSNAQSLLGGAGALLAWARGVANTLLSNLGGIFGPALRWFGGLPGRVWNRISGAPVKLGVKFIEWFGNAFKMLRDRLPGMFTGPLAFFRSLPSRIAPHMAQFVTTTVGWFARIPARALTAVSGLGTGLLRWIAGAFRNLIRMLPVAASGVFNWFTSLPREILSRAGNAATWLLGVGRDMVQGFINGIKDKAGDFWNAVKELNPVEKVKGWLGISSPSRVMREIGENTVQGFADGVRNKATDAQSAIRGALTPPTVHWDGVDLGMNAGALDSFLNQIGDLGNIDYTDLSTMADALGDINVRAVRLGHEGAPAIDAYQDALLNLAGAPADAILNKGRALAELASESQRAYLDMRDAIDSVTESFVANGATLDVNTRRGRDNYRAFTYAADGIKAYALAQIRANGDVKGATAVALNQADALFKIASRAGLGETKTAQLIARLLKIPPKRVTEIQTKADLARAIIENFKSLLGGVPSVKVTTLELNGKVTGYAAQILNLMKNPDLAKKLGINPWDLTSIGGRARGGFINKPELSWIGEAGPELVLPLSDRNRSLALLMRSGLLGDVGGQGANLMATGARGGDRIINFYGNLEFPNIKSGDDAQTLIENLEALV